MPLLVTGTIAVDTVHTPQGSAEGVLGGSCAYFAAAARLYTPVRVVAVVGGDWPAEHHALFHRLSNVCLEGLHVRHASRTFAWAGRYLQNMNERETLFTKLGVLEEAPPPIPVAYRDSRYIFLANTHPRVQIDLLDQFPQRRLAVADTMDLWINMTHGELLDLLRRIDGLILNDREAEQLTEMSNAVSAGRAILDLGPSFVVVKKGEHGAILVHREGVATVPAFPADHRQVIDPTGAGDAFAGGLMGRLAAAGRSGFADIQTAMAWGTVTASFAIESFSLDRISTVTRDELESRMVEFQAAARIG